MPLMVEKRLNHGDAGKIPSFFQQDFGVEIKESSGSFPGF